MTRKHVIIPDDLLAEIEVRGGGLSKMVEQGLRMLFGLNQAEPVQFSVGHIEAIARRVFREEFAGERRVVQHEAPPPPPEPPRYSQEVPDYVKPDEIQVSEPGVYRAADVCGSLRISLADLMEDLDEEDLLTVPQHLGYHLDSTGVHTALATAARHDQDTTEFQSWFDKQG